MVVSVAGMPVMGTTSNWTSLNIGLNVDENCVAGFVDLNY
jgi:hypothetical protein